MEVALPLIRRHFLLASFVLVAGVCAIVVFPASFLLRGNFLLGMAIFPWLLSPKGVPRVNYLLLALVVVFTTAVWLYQVRMFYFFTLIFSILLVVELVWGRVDKLVYLLILVMSPFFSQLTGILGFNFRMKLSQFAGQILQWVGLHVSVEGNTMVLQGTSFTVDDACAGLNMLAISFLAGIFMISYGARAAGRNISLWQMLFYFSVVVALNLFSNLFRIILLVFFNVLPDHPMHTFLGLIVFVVYVVIPLYWLTPWLVRRFGGSQPEWEQRSDYSRRFHHLCMGLLLLAIIPTGTFLYSTRKANADAAISDVSSFHLVRTPLKDGITRFAGEDVLVYVKSIPEFFSGEHTPIFCWRGSGYMFSRIQEREINGRVIYVGELTKGDEILHTAWWYSNGKSETTSQWEWRWKMFAESDRFYLINVTAATRSALTENVNCILDKSFFNLASGK